MIEPNSINRIKQIEIEKGAFQSSWAKEVLESLCLPYFGLRIQGYGGILQLSN